MVSGGLKDFSDGCLNKISLKTFSLKMFPGSSLSLPLQRSTAAQLPWEEQDSSKLSHCGGKCFVLCVPVRTRHG